MMLSTKYQGFRPCSFRQEDFFTFPYISLCKTCDPLGGSFLAPWLSSRKRLRAKNTPDLHLSYSKTEGKAGMVEKKDSASRTRCILNENTKYSPKINLHFIENRKCFLIFFDHNKNLSIYLRYKTIHAFRDITRRFPETIVYS